MELNKADNTFNSNIKHYYKHRISMPTLDRKCFAIYYFITFNKT
jgi:hypothetical protein